VVLLCGPFGTTPTRRTARWTPSPCSPRRLDPTWSPSIIPAVILRVTTGSNGWALGAILRRSMRRERGDVARELAPSEFQGAKPVGSCRGP